MKNLNPKVIMFLTLFTLIFMGCKKEEDKTTYQIVNNWEYSPSTLDQYLNGTLWEVVVYCYVGSDIVRQDNIASVEYSGGKSEIIEVPSNFEKVKVSFKLLPEASPNYDMAENHRLYVVAYTLLSKGTNNLITITGTTQCGPSLTTNDGQTSIRKAIESSVRSISK
jgi:hypothetical protein